VEYGPLIILVLVRCKAVHFDEDMSGKRFHIFVPSDL